jgi:hypothetical protein
MKVTHLAAAALVALPLTAGLARSQQAPAPSARTRPVTADTAPAVRNFRHSLHNDVPCSGCHSSRMRHGEVMIRSEQDCEKCHHVGPSREECTQCHNIARFRRGAPEPRTFQITASRATITLRMRFDHQQHGEIPCQRCHGDAMSRAPIGADCAGCHSQHHGATADCTQCHQGANALAKHTVADHTRCSTPACHGQQAQTLPASSREACLVCHSAQRQHIPGRACITCHPVRGSS